MAYFMLQQLYLFFWQVKYIPKGVPRGAAHVQPDEQKSRHKPAHHN